MKQQNSKKPRPKRIKSCDNCANCMYYGEGDFVCVRDPSVPVWVKEDWIPTGDYFYCGGKRWEVAQ